MIDTMKIGGFLAERRKALGLTQRQLAERLGMSDKSISKWERGVCLPDVSVYAELCGILGISINEFLAGEAIQPENIVQRAEENLLEVSADGSRRQKRLRCIIALLTAAAVVLLAVLGIFLYRLVQSRKPQNTITPLERESVEQQTAELLTGADGAFLARYHTDDPFTTFALYLTEYRYGRLVGKKQIAWGSYEGMDSPTEGMIALVPDLDAQTVKLVIAGGGCKIASSASLSGTPEELSGLGRIRVALEEETAIRYGEEQALFALLCGHNAIRTESLAALEAGDAAPENETAYYFSVCFGK